MQHNIGHKGALAHIFFQKFHAGRRVVKQIVHRDRGAHRACAHFQPLLTAALNAVHTGKFVLLGACQHLHTGHTGNAGQCLAAKAQCVNAIQILFALYLAGGMPHKGVGNILSLNAAAVIRDLDLLNTAAHDRERDLISSRIDRVFQQLFCRAGRALYYLPRRDQLGGVFI